VRWPRGPQADQVKFTYPLRSRLNRTPALCRGQENFPRDQQTPEALRAFQRAEIEKWWPIIKEANIKAN